jgi:hypothetical protein
MGEPHSAQNLTSAEFSVPQLEHCMNVKYSAGGGNATGHLKSQL